MRWPRLATICIALCVASAFDLPNDPAINALYARALAGDTAAVNECIAALEKRLAENPNDQLARVYLGSSYTLRSRDLPIGPAKLSALRKGIALMDEAAAAAPENASVQLNRAVTNQALPAFLGQEFFHFNENLQSEDAANSTAVQREQLTGSFSVVPFFQVAPARHMNPPK